MKKFLPVKSRAKVAVVSALALSAALMLGACSTADVPPEPPADGNVPAMGPGGPGQPPDGSGGPGEPPDGFGGAPGGAPGGSQAPTEYAAAYVYTEDTTVSGQTLESTGTDENVVLVDGDITVTLDNDTITRTSADSTGGDNASFYGVGAALLATSGTLNVQNSTIITDAKGGAGVFAYGDGVVNVSETDIVTTQDTSGGIHVAGGGTLHAENVTVETNGESSAAIRSDRGSGTMTVEGGSFTSNGTGSPAIYSTADIRVSDAALEATNSEAICIEGLNSIRLTGCDLTGNQPDDARNEIVWNVILYQSMSGDSEEGNATFAMDGGTLTANHGGMFYTTNTESTFVLRDVDIQNSADNPFLLRCTGNANQRGWGSIGTNGADCSFTAIQQQMEGDVQWDSISQLDMYLTEGSTLKGAFVQDESAAGDGGSGYAKLNVVEGCTWIVTGDSTLTELACAGTVQDAEGRTVTIKDVTGAVLAQGDSPYTITVASYSTTPDLIDAQSID